MQDADVTFLRAFKVWWSFTWRQTVLWWPLAIVWVFLVRSMLHVQRHAATTPEALRHGLIRLGLVLRCSWLLP